MEGWSTSLSRTGGRPSPSTLMTLTMLPAPMRTPPMSYCQSASSSGGTGSHPSSAGAADGSSDLGADVGCGGAGADRGDLDVGGVAVADDDDWAGGAGVGQAVSEAVGYIVQNGEGGPPLRRGQGQVGRAVVLGLREADDAALGGVHAGSDAAACG